MLSMLDQYRKESWVSSAFSCSNRQGSGRGRDDGTENCPFPMVTPAISSNLAVKSYLGSVSVWVTSMLPGQCHILMFDPMIERFGSKIPRAEKCLAHNAIYICVRETLLLGTLHQLTITILDKWLWSKLACRYRHQQSQRNSCNSLKSSWLLMSSAL